MTTFTCGRAEFRFLVFAIIVIAAVPTSMLAQVERSVESLFRQASEAMRQGNLQAAKDGFAEVIRSAPNFAEAYMNLGLVQEEQQQHEEAIVSFQKALQLKPGLRGAHLFWGLAEYRLNRMEPAVSALQKEIALSPNDANAWMWLGIVQIARGDVDGSVSALDKAAKLAPDNVDVLYHRGQAHLLVSRNSYEKMFKLDPNSWRVHQVLAHASSDAERPVDAIAEYQEAIKLAPTQPGLHEELGSEYRNAGKPLEAEAAFQRELEIDPFNVLARYKLGVLAIERGDGARAKELIEAALRQKAGLRHSDYNLGRAEMLLGQDESALKHFQVASSSETDSEVLQQTWFQLGIVFRRLHRMPEAQQAIATFQRMKNEQAEKSQEQLKRFKVQQNSEVAQPAQAEASPQ
jgi:tetratricopeptide (TPR) repeat protein